MATVMPASGLEQMLTDLADRLSRQEENTRRLEASLFAMARLPAEDTDTDDTIANHLVDTPRHGTTPAEIRWPQKRIPAEPAKPAAVDDRKTDGDLLWAAAGLVSDPLVGLDSNGNVRVWNPAAEELFGWSAEETMGRMPPFLPDDKYLEHERLTTEARFGRPARDLQTVRRRRNGQLIRVELSAAGAGDGVAFTLRPLGIPAPSLTREPETAPEPPRDVHLHGLASIGRQVAAVAHDFNNLLTVICGGTERLLEQFDENDSRKDVIELVAAAGKQAADVTRGLLDLACLGPNGGKPQVERCDLAAIVAAHGPVLQGLLGPERSLVLGVTDRPVEIAADPVRIGQVLLNLATNSRDAMPDGGTLAVEVEEADGLSLAIGMNGPVAVLTVSDTGVGMDADTLSHAFEPFFSTKPQGLGCGLGLATVADIVNAAGGIVIPESSPGTGTTIRVVFPIATSRPQLHYETNIA
jgi:two-component system cell cycle sensor histidine kinase/response regulator CckA